VVSRAHVGNIYVNRNVIGAVVGVQPFGGEGLSGTGPKAGGPLYLRRLLAVLPVATSPRACSMTSDTADPIARTASARAALDAYAAFLATQGDDPAVSRCHRLADRVLTDIVQELPGPTGERNTYSLIPRGTVLCSASTPSGARAQFAAVLATGNRALFATAAGASLFNALPHTLRAHAKVTSQADLESNSPVAYDAVLFEGDSDQLKTLARRIAERPGQIVTIEAVAAGAMESRTREYLLDRLVTERSLSVNTAAAGGNANLMTIG
jgi:RHH-type transcriptional regulator, proline utilization regulon repressor / proline dehydrogenase / delta 1-pyrroline-5-carboxylate dehydrogenase